MRRALLRVGLLLLLAAGLAALWLLTPAGDVIQPEELAARARELRGHPAAGPLVVAAFVAGGLLVVPVTLLVLGTAAAFGGWWAFAFAFTGILASAAVTYWTGALLAKTDLEVPAIERVRRFLTGHGVLSVALIRNLPIAPFSIINFAAGAVRVPFGIYMVGTAVGMAPGVLAICLFGETLIRALQHPSPRSLGFTALAFVGLVGVSLGLQWIANRRWRTDE